MKNKPKPSEYYDVHDILKYYGWKNIDSIFSTDNEYDLKSNGELASLDTDLRNHPEYYEDEVFEKDWAKNQLRILEDFGPISILVWW